jgi:hypothetical protein
MTAASDHAEIVRELTRHIIDFVEQPHPTFGNLPVCPFARKARLENRIEFTVLELTRAGIHALLPSFIANAALDMLICIDPRKDGLSSPEVYQLVQALNQELPIMNLMALGGHPQDPFKIDDLYTRRDPYPNVQLLRLDVGERAHQSIKDSPYYDRWTESNFRDVTVRVPDQRSA